MPTKSQEESISSLQLTSGGPVARASHAPSLMRRSQLNAVFGGHEIGVVAGESPFGEETHE
jgi:hypothetical protein